MKQNTRVQMKTISQNNKNTKYILVDVDSFPSNDNETAIKSYLKDV